MDAKATRKSLVKQLRAYARLCGAKQVRDDCGRARVSVMFKSICNKATATQKAEAQKVFDAYEVTWNPAKVDEEVGPESTDRKFRLRGKSFLLTYNWDFFGKALPDNTSRSEDVAALWRLWQSWETQKVKDLGVLLRTSTLERSLHSSLPGRVHFHWKVNLEVALDQLGTDGFDFHGVRPDVRATVVAVRSDTQKARGSNLVEASNRAHFYTWVPKKGSLHTATNFKPWENYRVLGKWLDDLWAEEKLTNDVYDNLACRVRVGYASRKRDVEQVRAAERDKRVDETLVAVDRELEKLRAPFRKFPQVAAWEDTFLNLQFRWKVLVVVADSASGKSSFAENLFERPCVVTVEEAENLDLKDFDRDVHDGLVLDNVNSWGQLLRWRAVLQARNAKSKGGQSATNVYSYTQYLFGVPVVATVDLDAPDAFLVDSTSKRASKWLRKSIVRVALERGEAFCDTSCHRPAVPNNFSLFAKTLKRRRTERLASTGE